jgi:hypothetical protein
VWPLANFLSGVSPARDLTNDALNEMKTDSYAKDDLPLGITYTSVARPGFGKPQF